jgi:hypothetical protein
LSGPETPTISLVGGLSACLIICAEVDASLGTEGVSLTGGIGVGAAAGADASISVSNGGGLSSGPGSEVECEGLGATGAVNSAGELSGGLTTATEWGCEAYDTGSIGTTW